MEEVSRAVRTGSPVALALADIDHFKKINDAYGQEAGDKALPAVADALRSHLCQTSSCQASSVSAVVWGRCHLVRH